MQRASSQFPTATGATPTTGPAVASVSWPAPRSAQSKSPGRPGRPNATVISRSA